MNLPNILTSMRMVLAVLFAVSICKDGFSAKMTAAIFFAVASITDYLDGYFAKKYNLITDFGKIMDPIADKMLTLTAFFIFAGMNIIDMWMVIAISFREVTITLWRLIAMKKGIVIAAENMGKYKTAFQMISLCVILLFIVVRESSLYAYLTASMTDNIFLLIYILMLITTALTLISGVSCFLNNRKANNV